MGRKLIGAPRLETRTVTKSRADEADNRGSVSQGAGVADGESTGTTGEAVTITRTEQAPDWIDNVTDVIPIEVVTAWVAIDAIVLGGSTSPDGFYWGVFALVFVATGLHMWIDIDLPDDEQTHRLGLTPGKLRIAVLAQVGLAMGAFLVWGLYLAPAVVVPLPGGEFVLGKSQATVALVLFTLLGPQLVPGLLSKLVGVDIDPAKGTIDDETAA